MYDCRRNTGLILWLLWLLSGACSCSADDNKIGTQLTGFEEIPALFSAGTGTIDGSLTTDGIAYTLSYAGLQGKVSAVRLQFGQRGVKGGIIAFLCGGGGKPDCPINGVIPGIITASDVQGPAEQGIAAGTISTVLTAIRAGAVYVNVLSDTFAEGEIRGQLRTGGVVGNTELDSGIEGRVTVGPVCPGAVPDPPDPKCADRPYSVIVVVKTADGVTEIARLTSNSDGEFRVSLPPGKYQLTDGHIGAISYPFLKPQTVTVEVAKFTSVTVRFDTGIR
jgi:CHRD domain